MSRKLTLLLCVSPLLSHHYHTHNTLTGVCGGSYTKKFCNTSSVSYKLTQFRCYLLGDRIGSHDTAPHFICQPQVEGPRLPQLWSDWATNRVFPWPPFPRIQLFPRTAHGTQGNTYSNPSTYYIIKDMVKDIDEQPDEEAHREREGGSQGQKDVPSSRVVNVFTILEALWTSHFWDFCGGFITWAWLIINSISSPSPHPEAHQELLPQNKRHCCHPGNTKGLKNCVRNWGKDQY